MSLLCSPCELFIKFLICHPKKYDNKKIREIVVGNSLDYIGEPYVDRLRAYCRPPRPFYPFNIRHARSNRFMDAEDLKTLFRPTLSMREANSNILADHKGKEIVESSLITRAEAPWIAALLQRNGIHVGAKAVQVYARYYFNISKLDSCEVRALVEFRPQAGNYEDPDEQDLARQLAMSRKSDPRRLAARSGVSPLASVLHQMRYGVQPSGLELSVLLKQAELAALSQAHDATLRGASEQARDFTLTAKMMAEMMESVGSPEEELQAELRKLELQTDTQLIPEIHQLTEGRHTVDLQPVGDENESARVRASSVPGRDT